MREVQKRARLWCVKAFSAAFLGKRERWLRVLEEANEGAQSAGITEDEATRIVKGVHQRPAGDVRSEIGDLIFCLAILAEEYGLSLEEEAWSTLYKNDDPDRIARIRTKCKTAEKIRGSEMLAQLCREF